MFDFQKINAMAAFLPSPAQIAIADHAFGPAKREMARQFGERLRMAEIITRRRAALLPLMIRKSRPS